MKNFIILVVSINLLMFFPLQSILDKKNHYYMTDSMSIVYKHAQEARIEGYFTEEIIDKMLDDLGRYFPKSEISYDLTETPRYRLDVYDEAEKINFRVTVPIKRLFIANNFFGIKDDDNRLNYTIQGSVASELLPR